MLSEGIDDAVELVLCSESKGRVQNLLMSQSLQG